ncbi:MAG: PstS family phosphate ABC transporter substrate-binding protein [Chloroflexota bacterium]|nr:PstS family phosphate ABC transporter substrate-binding protein [Chloroflexota bacterium]MDQ3514319.1 PstS family phosphate ABC transporter substrate-binding protein [Chloroflexota bacterium]
MSSLRSPLRHLTSFGVMLALIASFAIAPLGTAIAQDSTPGAGGEFDAAPYEAPADGVEGEIITDGSSTVFPITQAAAEEFSNIVDGVDITVDFSGTGGGFERFCEGETAISNASRAIAEDEVAICAENGVDYYEFEVAFDGITVVVPESNTELTCISVETLAAVWAPDSEITNLNQINPELSDLELDLYGPGTDSGTFDYFTDAIVGEEGASREDYTPSEDDQVLVEGVSNSEGGFGYFGYSYFAANEDVLNAVAVAQSPDLSDCVLPSPETIQDGTYAPLSRPLYVYVTAQQLQEDPALQEFMRFYLANAEELAVLAEYIGSPEETYAEDVERLETAIDGSGTPDSQSTPDA